MTERRQPVRAALGRALAALVAAFAATAAAAQTGGISVIVTDSGGEPLPGATVTISHETGYVKTTAVLSDAGGIADFPVLRPGSGYAVEISAPGFSTVRQSGLRVGIDHRLSVPVQMIDAIGEQVQVTATSEVVSLDTAQRSTKFTDNFIGDLPILGRAYQNVLTLAPGVQDANEDGNPNVHGSRARDFQAVVGGVNNVDPLTGQWMSRVNPDSIEEMEIIPAGAGVEFGRAQGGFARIVLKQGSNTHEGVAQFYYRTSDLDGDGAVDVSNFPDPDFSISQPSLQLAGPVIKDRLWYRVSLEKRAGEEPINVATGIETVEFEERTDDLQLTWQVSPRNKLSLRYLHDPRELSNVGISSLVDPTSTYATDQETQTTALTWVAPYSPRVLTEATVSWQDQRYAISPSVPDLANGCVAGIPYLQSARCTNNETGRVSGSYNVDHDDHRQRLTVKGQATVYGGRFWGMSHQFKLGVTAENERYFRELTERPTLDYAVIESFSENPQSGFEIETFGLAVLDMPVPQTDAIRATGTNWALYAEDQFKPRSNLTLTLGVRIDREEIGAEGRQLFDPTAELDAYLAAFRPLVDPESPTYNPALVSEAQAAAAAEVFTGYEDFSSFEEQIVAVLCAEGDSNCKTDTKQSIDSLATWQKSLQHVRRHDDTWLTNTNFSPYLSVAWDPFGNGKTALKAAAGRHYNNVPLAVPLEELEPVRTSLTYLIDFNPDVIVQDRVHLLNGISPSVNTVMLDPDLETPYQDELVLAFERELWAETSVSLSYIRRRFRDQLQDRNINVATGDYGQCVVQGRPIDPTIAASWGEGQRFDAFTDLPYQDDDPGPGDGRADDCLGKAIEFRDIVGGGGSGTVLRPDGVLDLYKQNPFWGDIYLIGNFNEIDYDAWVLELVRRQYRGWELQGSYTFAEAEGDGEDFEQDFDNDPSIPRDDLRGSQSYDQRHVAKLSATTITPWGVRLGGALSWQSGLPYSLVAVRPSFDTLPPDSDTLGITGVRSRSVYYTGERNDQRNDSIWNLDLRATRELALPHGVDLQLSAEVFNVLDEGTYTIYNRDLERGIQVNGANEAYRRFGRRWQIGARVAF